MSAIVSAAGAAPTMVNASRIATSKRQHRRRRPGCHSDIAVCIGCFVGHHPHVVLSPLARLWGAHRHDGDYGAIGFGEIGARHAATSCLVTRRKRSIYPLMTLYDCRM